MSDQLAADYKAQSKSTKQLFNAQNAIKLLFLVSIMLTALLLMWLHTVQPTSRFPQTWSWETSLTASQQFYLGIAWSVIALSIILMINVQKHVDMVPAGILVMIASMNLGSSVGFLHEPSQLRTLVSVALFVVLLSILNHAFAGWQHRWHLIKNDHSPGSDNKSILGYDSTRMRALWLCVPLFFVWSLLSASFVLGLIVLGVYLAGRTFEAYYRRGKMAHGLARRFTMMLMVSVLATLIIPFNWNYLFSVQSFSQQLNPASIQAIFGPFTIGLWSLIAVVMMVTFGSRHQKDLVHLVTFIFICVLSSLWLDNFAFAAITFAVWNGPNMHSAIMRLREITNLKIWSSSIKTQRTICIGLICMNLCLTFYIFQFVVASKAQLSFWT